WREAAESKPSRRAAESSRVEKQSGPQDSRVTMFCQYIKGVKLPDGFGSCFKHKVTDNDTNITGLKSHDCHIMMQRLLPYGLQNYLPDNIAKPIIELSSLFKQLSFERFMKKQKGYVRNKAKPEGSIAEGYVAEEALTLSSHYFRDVTTKFNRLERNVDPPPPTCQFQVFRSVCNTIGSIKRDGMYFTTVLRSTRTGPSSR
ncbi:hypothetical protein Tco_1463321, partial [Tanacetum coccineum]